MAVNVNYQKFNACIENLTKLDEKIYEGLNNYVLLGTSLEQKSIWNGSASETYIENINSLQQEIEEIHTQILNMISQMQSNYNHYKSTDQFFNETFSNIFSQISKAR